MHNIKNRDKSIDIARAIAMILVVAGHCVNETCSIEINKFSGLFFIPLFIFISGFFSKESKISTFKDLLLYLKRKILRLYVFYVAWELIYLALTNIFFKIGFYSNSIEYGEKIIQPISSIGFAAKKVIEIICLMGREPFCGAFWFLISLMFIIIGMSVINFYVNKLFSKKSEKYKQFIIGVVVVICYIIGCVMSKKFNIPRVSPAFTLMSFYYLGYLANYYKEKIKFTNIIIAIISLVILIILSNFGSVAMNSNSFPNGIFLMISSLSGIYLVMCISKYMAKVKYLSDGFAYIGKNTLSILALHFISFKAIMLIQWKCNVIEYEDIARLTGWNNGNAWYILYLIAGICIPLLCVFCYDKVKYLIIKDNKKEA